MSGVPYIRLFGDDWLSGTNELSLEERGALITIVTLTASTGHAPDYDLERISRRFGCTKGRAKKVIEALVDLGKVSIENGEISNQRAIKETELSQKNSEKQSENATKRWVKKEEKPNKNNGNTDAVAKRRLSQPEPKPDNNKLLSGSVSNTEVPRVDPRDIFVSGDFVFDENRWFTENEIVMLEEQNPYIDARAKLSDKKFRDWAFRADFQNPLNPARKWFEKQKRINEAEKSLADNFVETKQIKFGDMAHLAAALNRKGAH